MIRTPKLKVKEILSWCLTLIMSMPYPVTLRWIFYRALQQFGLTKKAYRKFLMWTRRVRKGFKDGWSPRTLIDDTRHVHAPTIYETPRAWYASFLEAGCNLDPWPTQPRIVIICFEANAMFGQFQYYAPPYVPLIPFGGDAGIKLKDDIATLVNNFSKKYEKPITVLYYGDYDYKGFTIPKSAFKDIRTWSGVDFEVIRMGLNEDQVRDWNIPENPEKPGEYQWEALDDAHAKALIQSAYGYLDVETLNETISKENEATAYFRTNVQGFLAYIDEEKEARR
jgi:hypothetical protein